MIDREDPRRRYNWTPVAREEKENRWSTLYVTINRRGEIWLTRLTHEAMGGPEAYNIMYDQDLHIVGMQPCGGAAKNAYPAIARGSRGGRIIYAGRLVRDFALHIGETVRFYRAFIDHTGTLILDMKDVRSAQRAKVKRDRW